MKSGKHIVFTATILCIFGAISLYGAYSSGFSGDILWNRGFVKVTVTDSIKNDIVLGEKTKINSLRMLSYRRARERARELLADKILAIRVTGSKSVQNILTESSFSREQFAHLLHERIVARVYPDDFYQTRCEAFITFGDIIRLLPYSYPQRPFPRYDNSAHATGYTSLVIDVRESSFTPLLMPSIYDEGGLEIFGPSLIDPSSIHASGSVLYTYSEDEAMEHSLAGEHPYYTTAIQISQGNPVISYKDVRRVFSNPENIMYLKQCRVFFIISGGENE